MRKLILAALAIALVCFAFCHTWPKSGGIDIYDPPARDASQPLRVADSRASAPFERTSIASTSLTLAELLAPPATGSLLVRVVFQDDGSPARGIQVRAVEQRGQTPASVRELTTDALGEAHFTRIPAGRVVVALERFELEPTVDVRAGEAAIVTLRTDRGQDVDGVVVDEQSQPVAGAEIWTVRPPNMQAPRFAQRSGALGEFALRNVAQNTIVGAVASGGRVSDFLVGVPDTQRRVTLRLVLRTSAAELYGLVTDMRGAPVAGARVHVAAIGGWTNSTRNADGSRAYHMKEHAQRTGVDGAYAILGLPPEACNVTITSTEHAPFVREMTLVVGQRTRCDAVLGVGAALAGTVRDERGEPVAGAHVAVERFLDREEVLGRATGPDGRYLLRGLPASTVRAWVQSKDKDLVRASLALSAGAVTIWNPVLGTRPTIEGIVVDTAQRPIPRCRVSAMNVGGWQAEAGGHVGADDAGRFVIKVPAAQRFTFQVFEPDSGFAIECKDAGEHASGEHDVVLVIPDHARATASISGELVDAEQKPIPLRHLSASDGTHSPRPKNLAAGDGAFRFAHLPPRKYWIDASPTDTRLPRVRLGPYELQSHETRELGRVPFPRLGTLKLVLARKDGKPLAQVSAETYPRDGGTYFHLDALASPDQIHQLMPGEYETTLFGEGFMNVEKLPFTIRAGETTTLNVQLEPAVRRNVRFPVPDPPGWTQSKRATFRFRRASGELVDEDELIVKKDQNEKRWLAFGIGAYVLSIETDDRRRFEGRFRITSLDATKEPLDVEVREVR